jgi:hypothetical protein
MRYQKLGYDNNLLINSLIRSKLEAMNSLEPTTLTFNIDMKYIL